MFFYIGKILGYGKKYLLLVCFQFEYSVLVCNTKYLSLFVLFKIVLYRPQNCGTNQFVLLSVRLASMASTAVF